MIKKTLPLLAAGLVLAFSADAAITIPTIAVGDAGNAHDSTGYGGVSYAYRIGAYEVTNGQYASFLNSVAASDPHGLYNENMGSSVYGGINRTGASGSFTYTIETGFGNKPVNFVSFWDAARFANWLTTGDTETGVYNLGGITNPDSSTIARDATAWNAGGVAVASENEWYKAAYYDPTLNGGAGAYWLYPTQSDNFPTATAPNGTDSNSANYSNAVGTVTDVGGYSIASSYYGAFDQGGNVWEWNDEFDSAAGRGLRGGHYANSGIGLQATNSLAFGPQNDREFVGFRVSSLTPIPEPSTFAALLGIAGLLAALIRRRIRGRR